MEGVKGKQRNIGVHMRCRSAGELREQGEMGVGLKGFYTQQMLSKCLLGQTLNSV